jgi:hypothetical protein
VPLEELRELLAYEDRRPSLKEEFETSGDPRRRREILDGALAHVERQLELVRARAEQLQALEDDLVAHRRRVRGRLRAL